MLNARSIGKRGGLPNCKKNGEYPVASCIQLLYVCTTFGLWSHQWVLYVSGNVFNIDSIVLLNHSALPFPSV